MKPLKCHLVEQNCIDEFSIEWQLILKQPDWIPESKCTFLLGAKLTKPLLWQFEICIWVCLISKMNDISDKNNRRFSYYWFWRLFSCAPELFILTELATNSSMRVRMISKVTLQILLHDLGLASDLALHTWATKKKNNWTYPMPFSFTTDKSFLPIWFMWVNKPLSYVRLKAIVVILSETQVVIEFWKHLAVAFICTYKH